MHFEAKPKYLISKTMIYKSLFWDYSELYEVIFFKEPKREKKSLNLSKTECN